ncbi:MAG: CHAP domain-containing protein [Oscillospiraceae bacterium]
MAFSQRTTAPVRSDDLFYSKMNPYVKNGFGLPNCTCYAWGRFSELLGAPARLGYGNAENWYGATSAYEKGSAPKRGAVIVWRKGASLAQGDGAGHVAVVEKIYSNGDILVSASNYGGTLWYTARYSAPYYRLGSSYTFLGFIYLPESESVGDTVRHVGTPVARDESKNQIEITVDNLRARLYPRKDGSVWGFINKGIYDIDPTDFADTDDGLRWYRLVADYNGIGDALWVAHSAEWAVLHFADRDGAALAEETERLRCELQAARDEAAAANAKLAAVRAAVA